MVEFLARIWNNASTLEKIGAWATVVAIATPFVFGIVVLVVQYRAKQLESNEKEKLKGQLESSQSELTELKLKTAQIAPRTLTTQQRLQLIELLTANPGPITIMVPMNDAEAGDFAEMIKEALQKAGWRVQGIDYTLPVNIPPGLTTNSGFVQQALSAIGLVANGSIDPNVLQAGWGTTLLLVGGKQG